MPLVLLNGKIAFVADMQGTHTERQIPGHFFQQSDFGGCKGIHFFGIHMENAEHLATRIHQR